MSHIVQRRSLRMTLRHAFSSITFQHPKSLTVKLMALGILLWAINAQSASQSAEQQFKSIDGEHLKRDYLASLTPQKSAKKASASADQNITSVLNAALQDESPVVVEKALQIIGERHQTQFSDQLVSLYNVSDTRFHGYSERVRFAIIETLGKLGGTAAIPLFAAILKKENATSIADQTLAAVEAVGDKALANDVGAFAAKMQAIVARGEQMGVDPMRYSMAKSLAQKATAIRSSLR